MDDKSELNNSPEHQDDVTSESPDKKTVALPDENPVDAVSDKKTAKAASTDGENKLPPAFRLQKMSHEIFEEISTLVNNELGIKMSIKKISLLESRIRKRMRPLCMDTFEQYRAYLFDEEHMDEELCHLLDVVTTNKTDFFREPKHFNFMRETLLPKHHKHDKPFRIWSAGCSSGEEPYTIAMVMNEFIQEHREIDYSIIASDVSYTVLHKAVAAIYRQERIADMDEKLKKKYFLRSKDRTKKEVRVVKDLRDKVKFFQLNFMQDDYPVDELMDIIFCRNVLIYFEKEQQEYIVNNLCRYLKHGGHLFLGHSETLLRVQTPLELVSTATYLNHYKHPESQ